MSALLPVAPNPEDRREHRRYPLRLELQYKLVQHGLATVTGSGRTLNISKRGVLFETDVSLPQRGEIVLEIEWPVLLEAVHRLKLVMRGRIVRGHEKSIAVSISTADFHIRRAKAQAV